MIKLVNRKEYAVYVEVGGVTKTIPAFGYLIVALTNQELSELRAKFRDTLNFVEQK